MGLVSEGHQFVHLAKAQKLAVGGTVVYPLGCIDVARVG